MKQSSSLEGNEVSYFHYVLQVISILLNCSARALTGSLVQTPELCCNRAPGEGGGAGNAAQEMFGHLLGSGYAILPALHVW